MPDKDWKSDAFKPQKPEIPGVSKDEPAKKEARETTPDAPPSGPSIPRPENISLTWIIIALGAVLVVGGAFAWWNHSSSAKAPEPLSEAERTAPAEISAKPEEKLATAPEMVATTNELAKPWSSKRFTFRDKSTGREFPAIVVSLPDGTYWGLSLREPFGNCEMEYVTDLKKLETEYQYRASHPMVGDPCNKTVFDLARYGTAPSGVVRGEIAQGPGMRPPMAIEIRTEGTRVLAVRIEQF
jgi:hypothetical protein